MDVGLFIIFVYALTLAALSLYGLHRYWILHLYRRHYKNAPPLPVPPPPAVWPRVTIQLPIFNELYVADRLIDCIARLDYPRERLQVQVLDDSTDETRAVVAKKSAELRGRGFHVELIHRPNRAGFKAGALAHALDTATGEFIAIFDADFLPLPDFFKKTLPHFSDEKIGLIQARWGHLNADYSLLTRAQSFFLDGHFLLEHTARNRSGAFINFNGTAGIWRRRTIVDAGGWASDTLTEDLDLSYRAQLRDWKFLFLPEVVCPAELPVDMGAFRSQQHRWTKGALQVAKKVLPELWRSPRPLLVKLEATTHLTANLAYVLLLLFSLLLLPSLVLRPPELRGLRALEIFAFGSTAISMLLFYRTVQRENGGSRRRFYLRDLPSLMALGVGMCWNNSRAVWEALFNVQTGFLRTPKFNIQGKRDGWREKRYRGTLGIQGLWETALAVYLAAAVGWCWLTRDIWAVPFILVFVFGFSYVGLTTLSHAALRK